MNIMGLMFAPLTFGNLMCSMRSTVIFREKLHHRHRASACFPLPVLQAKGNSLTREFPQLFLILVYIHPSAKATEHIISNLYKPEQLSQDSSSWVTQSLLS